MKILMLSNMYPNTKYPSFGTFIKNFEKGMEKQNIEILKVVKTQKKGKLLKLLSYVVFYIRSLIALRKDNYDISYIHYPSYTGVPLLFTKKRGPIVLNFHGSDILYQKNIQKLMGKINNVIIKKADLIIVPTSYYKSLIIERFGISSECIYIYPSGGIDRKLFLQKHLSRKEKILHLGFVGRISKKKGWNVFLKALSLMENSEFKATIIGSGEDNNKLEKTIAQHKFVNSIEYLGVKTPEELSDYYNEFDILIFPSETESLGLVGLEAMSCGVPVIGSNIPAICSYLIPGKNGYLFEANNPKDLYFQITNYLSLKSAQKEEMSLCAVDTARRYDSDIVNDQLAIRMRELLK